VSEAEPSSDRVAPKTQGLSVEESLSDKEEQKSQGRV